VPSRRGFLQQAGAAAAGLSLGPTAAARAATLDADGLAAELRALYARAGAAWERWGASPPPVRLPDGRERPRERAWRDHPLFVAATRRLLASAQADDAALGAWLLGSAPASAREKAARAALEALSSRHPLAAFEAARALERLGDDDDASQIAGRLPGLPEGPVRSAAAAALERLTGTATSTHGASPLSEAFGRGVCWWYEGLDDDRGAASFAELRALGVDWVSIHTWDPLQRAPDEPRLIEPGRVHAPRDLPSVARAARAAGLRVLFKPHLEMGHPPLSPGERQLLRGPDGPEKQRLVERLSGERAAQGWHGAIEMKSEADWRTWFAGYGDYLLAHARAAAVAGCDAFCVGREIDRTVLRREADWRALIARVRAAFPNALTYSAHHETFDRLGFWDALDAVGVAAYAPLSAKPSPTDADLRAGAQAVVTRLAAFSSRAHRPVWLTEAGFPALASAAARPWDEPRGPADPWLQARCWQALLAAVARRPEIGGLFGWLWEGVSQPPFRDASFTLKDKPAAYVLARAFRGLGS